MAKMSSTMVKLGTKAFDFSLIDVCTGVAVSPLKNKHFKAHVLMFICNHCPFVKHLNSGLTGLANDYQDKNIQFIAISSNDVSRYPDDSPDNMRKVVSECAYPFPYLFDESQDVAKAYNAVCTPDFFIYDANLLLVYRGQFDDSRPGNNIPVTGHSIRNALDAIIKNEAILEPQIPSIGCGIKWKEPLHLVE